MSHILISYSHHDSDFVENLHNRLTNAGFDVWIDTDILASQDWREEIDHAIQRAAALIVIITPRSRASEYVTYEWAFAWGAGVTIIPILREKTEKIHPRLESLQYLDFTNPNSRPWERLVELLRRKKDMTADGIPPMERIHGYSGQWKITTEFAKWQDQPVEKGDGDRVEFDGSMFLLLSADGQRGFGTQTGQLHVSIGDWSATYQVANQVTDARMAQDGSLHIFIQVLSRTRIKGDLPPHPYRDELFGRGHFEVTLLPSHGSPRTLTGGHTYPSGYRQEAKETYKYEGFFGAASH
jgi:hypothetical protein